MQYLKKARCLITISILCFFVTSIDFMLMPISDYITGRSVRWVDIITGLLFWASLVIGITFCILYSKLCKEWYSNINTEKDVYKERKAGLFTFFSNPYAFLADLILIISFIAFIALMIFTDRTNFICYFVITLFVFSFIMHCILNGKSFYVQYTLSKIIQKQ